MAVWAKIKDELLESLWDVLGCTSDDDIAPIAALSETRLADEGSLTVSERGYTLELFHDNFVSLAYAF